MDPFVEVQQDAEDQLKNLQTLLNGIIPLKKHISKAQQEQISKQLNDLNETIEDLKDSIEQIKTSPEFYPNLATDDIASREKVTKNLQQQYISLSQKYQTFINNLNSASSDNPFASYQDDQTEIQNKIADTRNFQVQQELHYQDEQLDDVYDSVKRINEQARLMGTELDDHAMIIGEFEEQMDRTQGKLSKSMKRLNVILEKNKERFSDCCIMLLIIALIVLLVLLFVL